MPAFTIKEQLVDFPIAQMAFISIIRIAEPIAFTSMFPYIYFMIKHFGITDNDADIARFSGYLASAFSFCQFLSSVPWGKASDKFGRKPVLLVGLSGTAISMVIFGFSTNFYSALMARMLMGLLNGNVSVIRTVIGEIAVEPRHQPLAFSSLTLLWSAGSIMGNWLGGVLTDTKNLPEVLNEDYSSKKRSGFITHLFKRISGSTETNTSDELALFEKYPFVLSNVVVACILCCSIIAGWLFFEETHEIKKYKRDIGLEVGDYLRHKLGFQAPIRPWQKYHRMSDNRVIDDLFYEDSSVDDHNDDEISKKPKINEDIELQLYATMDPDSEMATNTAAGASEEDKQEAFTPPVVNSMISNFILSFHNLVYGEFLPVFLAAKVQVAALKFPLHIKGGFGFTSDAIGILLSLTGVVGIGVVLFIFPIINTYFSTINGYRVGLSVFPIIYVILPLLIFTLPEYSLMFKSKTFTGIVLYAMTGLNTFAGSTAFSQIIILIHRASPRQHRALINGSTMSITALARCVAPLIWGWLMSKFDTMGYSGLSWWTLAVISLGGLLHSFVLEEYEE
ncbi:major facilitator superfamily domain-containing protein [Scheffersomyces amazonensis]|uniref:major facilitator superfamily domain-containing protein n=1 Tax=Scheffersomyces amazonensis TaxID=1078765 RepID=UPI00315CB2DF